MATITKCDRCTRTTVDAEGKGWTDVTITVGRGVPHMIKLCDVCQEVLADVLQRTPRQPTRVPRLRAIE